MGVVLYHSTTDFGFGPVFHRSSTPLPLALWNAIIAQGYLAVDFFFLLSGFILAYNYVASDGGVRGGKRAFLVARIARIYPVYLLGIALGLIGYLQDSHGPKLATMTIATHLLLVQSWIPAALAFDLNPPAWSLAAEALFYALFPLLLPLFAEFGRRMLVLVAIAAWMLYLLVLLIFAELDSGLAIAPSSVLGSIASFNPLVRLSEFLIGLALGLLFVRASALAKPSPATSRRLTAGMHDLALVALLVVLGAVFVVVPMFVADSPVANIMAIFALPLLAPLIYLLALQRGLLVWALSLPLVAWLGEISYGIYILHWPLWSLLKAVPQQTLPFNIHSVWFLAIYLLLLISAAGLSFTFFEGPTRRAIRARWGQPKRANAAVPQPAHVQG